MKVACDLDGVLADFVSTMTDIFRSLGVELPPDYVPADWNWKNANLPEGVMGKAWDIIINTPHFWEKLNPLPGIVPMAEFFWDHRNTCDLYFLTSRTETIGSSARAQSENWLRDHLSRPSGSINVIVVTHSSSKVDVLRSMSIDYFVDDCYKTLESVASLKTCQSFLLTQPWNATEQGDVNRINHLSTFFKQIKCDY